MVTSRLVHARMFLFAAEVTDGLTLPMEDPDRERPLQISEDRRMLFRMKLVHGQDRVVPPAGDEQGVFEDGG